MFFFYGVAHLESDYQVTLVQFDFAFGYTCIAQLYNPTFHIIELGR